VAGNGTSYTIDIQANASSAERAAAAVDALASRLNMANDAAAAAADALRAGETAYARAEFAADRAAKAVERVSIAADAQRGKLKAAMDAGDASSAERAAAKLQALNARQAEAVAAANKAKAALAAEGVALEGLKASAAKAADAQGAVTKALAQQKKVAEQAAKSAAAAKGSGKMTDALDGVAKLSGPLGGTAMQVREAAEGFGKLKASLGAAGPYVAIGAALVAISIGMAAISAAAIAGIAKITKWAVLLSDKEKQIEKETARLRKGWDKLFSGLKIGKLVANFSSIVDLFDETNASGRAVKVVFESLFQPIVDGVADFLPKVRTAFIEFQIMALRALIAIKPYGSTILTVVKVLGVLGAVLTGVVLVAVGAVALSLTMLAFAVSVVVSAAAALVAGAVWLSLKLQELSTAVWEGLVGAFQEASAWLSALDLSKIGSDILQGLINGIVGAGPAVVKALGGVVNGAIAGAKALLGIASPSKVFAEIGQFTGEGMAVGVEGVTGEVQGALETMISPPEAMNAAPAESGRGGGGASLAGATFNFYGVQGAEQAVAQFEQALTRVLEGDTSMLGGAVPA
jgi:hypothetical protein